MPRVLTVDGSVKIGAYRFPDRKKPCLCVEKGNTCTVYGSFIDTDRDSFIEATGEDLDCLQLSTEHDGIGYIAVVDTGEDEITVSLDIFEEVV